MQELAQRDWKRITKSTKANAKGTRVLNVILLWLMSAVSVQPQDTAADRSDFLKILERPRVPLAPELHPERASRGLTATHFTFAAEAGERVPGIIIQADKAAGRRPVVILLHGTGDSKEGMLDLASEFAGRGFVAVAIDGRYHGERTRAGYDDAIFRAYKSGKEHPFLYDTVWDVMRLIDY